MSFTVRENFQINALTLFFRYVTFNFIADLGVQSNHEPLAVFYTCELHVDIHGRTISSQPRFSGTLR